MKFLKIRFYLFLSHVFFSFFFMNKIQKSMPLLATNNAVADCDPLLYEDPECSFPLFDEDVDAASDKSKTQSLSGPSRMVIDAARSERLPLDLNLIRHESVPGHSSSFAQAEISSLENSAEHRDRFVIQAQINHLCLLSSRLQ